MSQLYNICEHKLTDPPVDPKFYVVFSTFPEIGKTLMKLDSVVFLASIVEIADETCCFFLFCETTHVDVPLCKHKNPSQQLSLFKSIDT